MRCAFILIKCLKAAKALPGSLSSHTLVIDYKAHAKHVLQICSDAYVVLVPQLVHAKKELRDLYKQDGNQVCEACCSMRI